MSGTAATGAGDVPTGSIEYKTIFAVGALLLFGTARLASLGTARVMIGGISVLGLVLALAGIVQHATFNGRIYGIWTSEMGGTPFGPFVNRNHFAGWMLMGIPLVFAYFCGRVARGMRGVTPGLRNRVMWFSSAEASDTMRSSSPGGSSHSPVWTGPGFALPQGTGQMAKHHTTTTRPAPASEM